MPATTSWRGYLLVGLLVLAELVIVSGRGHIDWQSTTFGPKGRRKRQVAAKENNVFGLLSSLIRPASHTPASSGFLSKATTAKPTGTNKPNKKLTSSLSTATISSNVIDTPELKELTWSQYIDSTSMLWLPQDVIVPGFISGRAYYLGYGNPNFAYQSCFTPLGETGRCRFAQHCARPEITVSIDAFLTYACPIGSDYMGVCCSESIQITVAPTTSPTITTTSPTTTTASPTTTMAVPKTTTTVAMTITTTQATVKKGCGELTIQTTRIVGGQPADKGEWPWMAALLRDMTDQYCGGVLITDQHVLTASHCVDNSKPEDVIVRLGEYDFSKVSDSRRDFAVGTIFMHESYDRRTFTNDIAIIKLKEKATFTGDIWPICLPPANIDLTGVSAFVSGWGTTSYSGTPSDILLEVLLPIWNRTECQAVYTQPISDLQLCAGYKQGGKDSCQGDSGGPLMYQMSNGRWASVGVVSWGIRCAEKDKPGVYTKVSAYSDWIKGKVLA